MSLLLMGLRHGALSPAKGIGLLVIPVLLQVTAVALLALALIRFLGASRPQFRYVVSLGALLCVLLSPVLAGLARWTGGVSVRLPLPPPLAAALPTEAVTGNPQPVPAPPAAGPTETTPLPGSRRHTTAARSQFPHMILPILLGGITAVLWLAWGGGCLLHLARLIRGRRESRGLLRDASPLVGESAAGEYAAENLTDLLEQIRSALGCRSLPPILVSPSAPVPLVVGTWHPRVLLPTDLAGRLSPEQLRSVLIHECAHVMQGHPWGGLAQRLAVLLFWPHPLVHALTRTLAQAREEVCDNFALRASDAPGYARTLLLIAAGIPAPLRSPVLLGLLPARWCLEDRVRGILDPGRNRGTHVSQELTILMGAILFGVGGMGAVVRLIPVGQGRLPPSPAVHRRTAGVAGSAGTTVTRRMAMRPMVHADITHAALIARTHRRLSARRPRMSPAVATEAAAPAPTRRQAAVRERRTRLNGRRWLAARPPQAASRQTQAAVPHPPVPAAARVAKADTQATPARANGPVARRAAGPRLARSTPVSAPAPDDIPVMPGGERFEQAEGMAPLPRDSGYDRSPYGIPEVMIGMRPPPSSPALDSFRGSRLASESRTTPRYRSNFIAPRVTAVTVWVNTRTGNYHYPGDPWYGTTQRGEYMDEPQARALGYHQLGKWQPQAL